MICSVNTLTNEIRLIYDINQRREQKKTNGVVI